MNAVCEGLSACPPLGDPSAALGGLPNSQETQHMSRQEACSLERECHELLANTIDMFRQLIVLAELIVF